MTDEKPKKLLYLLRGTDITAESLMAMYEKVTGKKATPEALESARRQLAERSVKLDAQPSVLAQALQMKKDEEHGD